MGCKNHWLCSYYFPDMVVNYTIKVEIFARRYFCDIIVLGQAQELNFAIPTLNYIQLNCKRLFLSLLCVFIFGLMSTREICKNKNLAKISTCTIYPRLMRGLPMHVHKLIKNCHYLFQGKSAILNLFIAWVEST